MMRFTGSNNGQVPAPFGLRDAGPEVFMKAATQSMGFHNQNLQQTMENSHDRQQVVTPSPRHG